MKTKLKKIYLLSQPNLDIDMPDYINYDVGFFTNKETAEKVCEELNKKTKEENQKEFGDNEDLDIFETWFVEEIERGEK